MSRAISREGFDELKNYLGVYLQQGRVILDSDWNENQDIAVSFLRRIVREGIGEGSPNSGFAISPAFPPPLEAPDIHIDTGGDIITVIAQIVGACLVDLVVIALEFVFGSIPFFLNFPGDTFEDFERIAGWATTPNIGNLRLGQDRPFSGRGFLRLSGHTANVLTEIAKTLPNVVDISQYELATFRFRLNEQAHGDYDFFLEDLDGNRSIWKLSNPAMAKEVWLAGFVAPLNVNFHILSTALLPGFNSQSYSSPIATFGGAAPSTWTLQGAPPWLTIQPADDVSDPQNPKLIAKLLSDPAVDGGHIPADANGSYTFTVTGTDANNVSSSMQYTLRVTDPPDPNDVGAMFALIASALGQLLGDMFTTLMRPRVSTNGHPADLTRIKKYGFAVYQDAQPLVWDFDALQLGSVALQRKLGENNFIIRGSELGPFLGVLTLLSLLMGGGLGGGGGGSGGGGSGGGGGGAQGDQLLQNLLDLMNADFNVVAPSIENAGRMYVDGLPCIQLNDELYSQQADPNDPPLAEPTSGVRTDTVYLDVWTDPVTYVDDPEIRELALGGPDTCTRLKIKQRVRVNQGGGMPQGDGRGLGTLATAGSYTGTANRFYRVEVDGPGDIGTATFRWSDDNASTIARILAPVPPGSTSLVVEDASAFHPNDKILIRKEFGSERHAIASIFSNVINLQQPTGAQLAALPAALVDPSFTTFSLDDRPMVQRWNDYGVAVTPDQNDATISAAIALNDGVQVRFGGRAMAAGDFWNFRTRYLAGDEASGIGGDARIEPLSYANPRGVVHHYAELATLTRDAASLEPKKIGVIQDRRRRAGNASTTAGPIANIQVTSSVVASDATPPAHLAGGISLPVVSSGSKVVVFLTGTLFINSRVDGNSQLNVQVSFYNDQMTDPETEPDKGKIQDRVQVVRLGSKPLGVDVPFSLMFVTSALQFAFLPSASFTPTSVQLLFQPTDKVAGTDVQVTDMQLFALELKKSF